GHVALLVDVDLVAAHVLRGVTGDVRGAHQARDARALVVDHDDADRATHAGEGLLPRETMRLDRAADRLRDFDSPLLAAAFEQDAELVAAEARDHVVRAQPRLHELRDLAQQLVAGGVAERVVDDLELVEVEVQERVAQPFLVGAVEGRDEPVLELATIDEAGQRVVRSLVGKLPEQARLAADVVEHHHRADDVADTVADRGGGILDRHLVPGLVDEHGVLGQRDHAALPQAAEHGVLHRRARVLVDDHHDLVDRLAARIADFEAREVLGDRVDVIDTAFRIGGDDAVTDGLKRYLRPLLLLEDAGLGHLAFRDVRDRPFVRNDVSVVVVDRARVLEDDDLGAVLATQAVLEVAHVPLRLEACEHALAVDRVDVQHRRAADAGEVLRTVVTQHLHERRVDRDDLALPRGDVNAVHHVLEQAAVARFAGHEAL